MNNDVIGIAAALLSAAAWAAGAILYQKFGRHISSAGMNLTKGVINLLLLSIVVLLSGYQSMDPVSFSLLGISGILGIAIGDTLFFEALQKVGAPVLVLLSLLGQVLTVLFAVAFLGEQLTPLMWSGVFLVAGGITFVVFTRISGSSEKRTTRAGFICGLGAVLCMSASVIVAKKGLAEVSAVQGTFVRMLWGTMGLVIWGGIRGRLGAWVAPFREASTMKHFFLLVSFISFGGFWLFHVAIKYTEVSVANTLSSTEPLFVIPLAAIFLKERTSGKALAGTLVAMAGILLLCTG
ncbi:DMT family transporter [Geobacter sp. DSM 9736]|uniref:DMT family transporter n=1 Tax=Geobacter sp. DSM 9736 TaxID=1277350 RepID=UPI000B5E0F15|nr:DMT family transporter [Geobacter sp. DSM 9736]SNB47722.1 Uncharacterized membrane protein [Geobacter sp. DSM 9736]